MKIALISKVPIHRIGMASFLKGELPCEAVIIEAENASMLQEAASVGDIDLIIVASEQMPDILITQNVLELRNSCPASKLIIVGKKENPHLIINYFSMGVSGYVDNEAPLSELTKCLENVDAGRKFVSLDLLWILARELRFKTNFARTKPALTRGEYRIVRCLMEGKRVTWIAKELNLKPSTISTVKARIFKKLGVSDIAKLKDRIAYLGRLDGNRSARKMLGS